MSSSSDRKARTIDRVQLWTPPPTPNKQRDRSVRCAMPSPPPRKQRTVNDLISPAPPMEKSLLNDGQSKSRKNEGKRLHKAEKNRKRLAAKKAQRRGAKKPLQMAHCPGKQDATLTPPRELTQKNVVQGDVASSKPSLDAPPGPATFEPDRSEDEHESCQNIEEVDVQTIQPQDSNHPMLCFESIESSDSESCTAEKASMMQNLLYKSVEETVAFIDSMSSDPMPHSQPGDPSDQAVVTTALKLLLTLQAEQTTLNSHSFALEAQITALKSTRFKVDYVAIAKLEEELDLTVALSFDMFVGEWAFRDLLEVRKEDLGFDLVGALAEFARDVEGLVKGFEDAMAKIGK
ncbi:hypothetical protein IAQ61_007838 [Plenodomus lingam]|uniref:Predicted protein n=1 Tax=Leptosphaeria maculans (strain JN3 / isolate v23.1.3 / race Av1-4-5-6-7-8) TaxID=985895 RepID=E5A4I4_LEPMJ|nr:predicted protein [Plenodomus lingam JN3]KAH9867246.1 hypothetical protein IAQ61_007838 [Plenodomus lingam]CBX98532.1 predicted protein [Plenodomus lingam JN3]